MANKVVKKNEVYINGVYYPISRPVQKVLASIFPAKVTIGDTTRDSQTRASVISWSDFRGGIGVERMESSVDVNRAWWSTCSLRYKRHLVLPPLTTQVTNADASTTGSLDIITQFNNEIYGIWSDQKVYRFNQGYASASDAFGDALDTLPSAATDAVEVRMGGTLYMVIAHGTGYTYTSNASCFTDDTKDAKFLTFWDDKLWGIDNTGQLWHAATIGSETDDAKLPLPDGYVTDLFVARNASGNPVIYAMTKVGLFAHDSANSKFVETQLSLPFHENNGEGSVRWRDSVYIPAGLGIYKYINGSNSAVVTLVGLDRDHGLPTDQRGTIKQLLGTHNDLLAFVDGTIEPSETDMFDGTNVSTSPLPAGNTIDASTGLSAIFGWNEMGWETKWLATETGETITSSFVSNAQGNYRLYWGHNGYMYYQQLQTDVINPTQVTTFNYASSAEHYTPWFSADQVEVDKLALKLKVETEGCSSNETVAVSYATDYTESYTSMGTITSNGLTTYTFGSKAGTTFRSIQFKIVLSRGSTSTETPDVISTTFEFRKKLPAKFAWAVDLDLTKAYKSNTPKALRSNLLSAIESNTLLEFTFRDDSSTNRNYYVDITSAQGMEHTAYDERGSTRLLLAEP